MATSCIRTSPSPPLYAQDMEDAERRHAAAERERQLYFMSARDEDDDVAAAGDEGLGDDQNDASGTSAAGAAGAGAESDSAGGALRGRAIHTFRFIPFDAPPSSRLTPRMYSSLATDVWT